MKTEFISKIMGGVRENVNELVINGDSKQFFWKILFSNIKWFFFWDIFCAAKTCNVLITFVVWCEWCYFMQTSVFNLKYFSPKISWLSLFCSFEFIPYKFTITDNQKCYQIMWKHHKLCIFEILFESGEVFWLILAFFKLQHKIDWCPFLSH